MNENIGHNWRRPLDDEYDRLVNLSAIAMIAASRKPELSKQSAFYARQAIGRRGGAIGDNPNLVRDIALAVFSDVTDRAAGILRGRFSDEVISALERHVTTVWRGAFDQMVQAFPLKH
jgi:non-ribosomal peptide synthetase component F